jgi:hypothetical protein
LWHFLRQSYGKTVKISDFPKLFPKEKIASDLRIKSTSTRGLEEIYLNDYLPMSSIERSKIEGYRYEDIKDDLFT